jgi:hypothetical protein
MRQSEAQVLGRKGQRWFEAQLPSEWILQRPTEDFGIDGVVAIGEQGELNGMEFRVQIKASRKWERQGNAIVLSKVKRHTVRDWIAAQSPTLLALYEEESDTGHIYWVLDLFDGPARIKEFILGSSATVTLKVPCDCPLDAGCWQGVRQRLREGCTTTSEALGTARLLSTLLPLMNTLLSCLRNLYEVQCRWGAAMSAEPKTEKGLCLLLETTTHREVVWALRKFLAVLPPNIRLTREIEAVIEFYISKVAEFYPQFGKLIDCPDESLMLDTNPEQLLLQRPHMVFILIDLLFRFSSIPAGPVKGNDAVAYHPERNPFPFPFTSILRAAKEEAGKET